MLNSMLREGELRPGDVDNAGNVPDTVDHDRDRREPDQEWTRVNKQRRTNVDEDTHPRISSRPRVVKDYQVLNNPMPELSDNGEDSSPELLHDPDENEHGESPIEEAELVYAVALNEKSALPDNLKTLKEACDSPKWSEWEKAVKAELDQLHQMGTWELVDLPKGWVPVSNKWVLVRKYNKEGILEKYKARLVAKGYSQIPGMDYTDTFSLVVRLETMRALLALALSKNWEIQQMDVKGAYLNGTLKEEVYMRQPVGFEDGTECVCCLIKTLYGLKQSGREWNLELNKKLVTVGFHHLWSDPCAYVR